MLSKKFILIAATALVSGVIAAPAFADVNVTVDVDKTKTITILENIDIDKTALITVELIATADGLAQTDLLVNAESNDNVVELLLGGSVLVDDDNDPATDPVPSFTKRHGLITGSVNGNTGVILQMNQDVGDNSNQGNLVSASIVDVADDPATTEVVEGSVAHSQVEVEQDALRNNTTWIGTFPTDPDQTNPNSFHVRAEMVGLMNANAGAIIQGNQNAGQNSNQHNAVGLALGIDAGVALAEGALGQETSDNEILDLNTFKKSSIVGSMNGNSGIVMFNQNAGHNNNQAAIINVAATTAATSLQPVATGP